MPGPEVYAGCPFMSRFAGWGLDPPPRGVGDAAPYSGDPKACV